VRPAP